VIYFIKRPDDGRIKIGTTVRLSQRLRQLVAEHGNGLIVLAVTDGDRDIEQALHQRFAGLRIVGEWFEPGDDLLGFIVAEAREWDGSDEAPEAIFKMLTIRGTPEWRAWLDRAAKFCRINTSSLVDVAVTKYAREQGFTEPPPDR
jgi:hypothetical protein